MRGRHLLRFGAFVVAFWLGGAAVASPQTQPAQGPAAAPSAPASDAWKDIGFDVIPNPTSDIGLGTVVNANSPSWGAHGDYGFGTGPVTGNIGLDYRNWQPHVVGTSTAFSESDLDLRAEIGIPFNPDLFIGIGYDWRANPLGTASGVGFGVDKLPHYERWFSLYGSGWYYPFDLGGLTGGYPPGTPPAGPDLAYRILKYRLGAVVGIPKSPFYLDVGAAGDVGREANNESNNFTHAGFFVGLRAAFR